MSGKPLNDAIEQVIDLIKRVDSDQRRLPATFLFNEGWMLRLIFKTAESQDLGKLLPRITCQWFSEAKLYTPFKKARGRLCEGFTNADAVVGNFEWGNNTKTGVHLSDHPKRFEVFEAKMYSGLSKGVTAARWFNQAARTVACIAHTFALKNLKTDVRSIERLGFWVVAPEDQIKAGVFAVNVTSDSIREQVDQRIRQFSGQGLEELELWREEYFVPVLERLKKDDEHRCISWEDLINTISNESHKTAIQEFYHRCKDAAGRRLFDPPSQKPLRGRTYRIVDERDREPVVVCCPGEKTSRVFTPKTDCESFTIANHRLQPTSDGVMASLPIPNVGDEMLYRGKRVVVKSRGPCRSRVVYLDSLEKPKLVDNHFLKTPDTGE